MADKKVNATDFLTPRDIRTLPQRKGRPTSNFYPELVKAFLSAGEAAMDVDVAKIGRKPETVRSALAKAIRALEVQKKVRVSKLGDEVILIAR